MLIVIDMQNDFTYGALKNEQAISVISNIAAKIEEYDGEVVFTRDTHYENYLETREGRYLPVEHCIKGKDGWQIVDELERLRIKHGYDAFDKETFGSVDLAKYVSDKYKEGKVKEVELVGVCTDICVISNAMLIKAFVPELDVKVDSKCCAGVTVESHENALNAMKACQIEIV